MSIIKIYIFFNVNAKKIESVYGIKTPAFENSQANNIAPGKVFR